jgi:hypothetical protein
LRVPSTEICSDTISGRAMVKALIQLGAQILGDVGHLRKVGNAAHIEPMPQLRRPHAPLLLRHADRAQRLAQFLAGQADQGRFVFVHPGIAVRCL